MIIIAIVTAATAVGLGALGAVVAARPQPALIPARVRSRRRRRS